MEFPYKTASMVRKEFGTLSDGRGVGVWYLANRQGMRAEVLELGGSIHRLVVIGGDLKKHDVALGAPDLALYERGEFLAAVMRGCGVGAGDEAVAEGIRPTGLPPIMRGSEEGRHLVLRPAETDGEVGADGDRGACDSGASGACPDEPCEVHFALTEENELVIGVENPRLLPCAPGPYFNLAGRVPGNVLDHAVAVDVSEDASSGHIDLASYRKGKVLADDVLLPECLGGAVAGFDLCLPIDASGVREEGGCGDCALTSTRNDGLAHCATVYCGRSRVYMDLSTDAPAVRLTTFQPEGGVPVEGKARVRYGNHGGFMLVPMLLPLGDDSLGEQGERLRWPSVIAAYRFTADYPEGYHTDSACMDRIL